MGQYYYWVSLLSIGGAKASKGKTGIPLHKNDNFSMYRGYSRVITPIG